MKPYYEQDGITIYHGDCREVELPTGSVDLVIADPPYGMSYLSRGTHPMIQGDDDNSWVPEAMRHALRALKTNRHFYVFGPDMPGLTTAATMELIWDKGRLSAGGGNHPWSPGHERLTFGVYSRFKSHRNVGNGNVRLRRSTVLHVPKVNNGRGSFVHPNQKPVMLMRVLIEASSQFDEVVFDPFMGSGTTLVAAKAEGRSAIGIEVEERYCEIAAKRLAPNTEGEGT